MNVLIVPDEGGQSRRLNLPLFVVRIAMWLLVLAVIGVLAAVFSYSRFAHKALDWDRLAEENERLKAENRRILKIAREVEEGREALALIVQDLQEGRDSAARKSQENGRPGQLGGISDEALILLKGRSHSPEQFLSYGLPTLMPVNGFVSQHFLEDRLFPGRSHRGIDIAGKSGVPVVSAASGQVVFEGWTPYFGNCIMLAHRDGYLTFYGHNQMNLKKAAEEVKRGEPIALLGSTGRSSAPHLHFEIWKDGAAVDPMKMLQME